MLRVRTLIKGLILIRILILIETCLGITHNLNLKCLIEKCYYSKKQGHYIQICFNKKRDEKQRKVDYNQDNEDVYNISNDVNNDEVLMVST